ncbi:MAG: NAD(P)H-dependent oxidoreductase [Ginsengibacter sp.]
MYTIISSTNRANSHSEKVAKAYQSLLLEKNISASLFTLQNLDVSQRNHHYISIENELLIPAQKIIFIIPEYNGSYPGVLKTMIDISDVYNVWAWKKALLTGVSTGRAGNLRGMDHLTGSLQYLNMYVHPNKLPISTIDKVMDTDGKIHNPATLAAIDKQLEEFINF